MILSSPAYIRLKAAIHRICIHRLHRRMTVRWESCLRQTPENTSRFILSRQKTPVKKRTTTSVWRWRRRLYRRRPVWTHGDTISSSSSPVTTTSGCMLTVSWFLTSAAFTPPRWVQSTSVPATFTLIETEPAFTVKIWSIPLCDRSSTIITRVSIPLPPMKRSTSICPNTSTATSSRIIPPTL